MFKIGLIVNPIAGMGGSVALKGTDGKDVLNKALSLGAFPLSPLRTERVFKYLTDDDKKFTILTCSGNMGEWELNKSGIDCKCVYYPEADTSSVDTIRAASIMLEKKVDILVFVGGDGTARDIYSVIKDSLPVLGIPAGVKIHSAVYAKSPKYAGELLKSYISGQVKEFHLAEVMDIDEEAFRSGVVKARLFGYMNVPKEPAYMQDRKTGKAPESEAYCVDSLAAYVVDSMDREVLYLIGSGSTTQSVMNRMNLEGTLLGIDAVKNGEVLGRDLTESELFNLVSHHKEVKLIVTLIGGQGYVFGRGNQQISPRVIRLIGRDNIIIISTPDKLNALFGKPLLVDTGDERLDEDISGYIAVVDGYNHRTMRKLEA